MSMDPPRPAAIRKADTLAALSKTGADVWVATANVDGTGAHLVPLSLCWTADRAVVAVEPHSKTAINAIASKQARLAVGPTRDLVMIDAEVERAVDSRDLETDVALAYAEQTGGWDPRDEEKPFVFLVFRPLRLQAWREVNEIEGRTLLRHGEWLI